MNDLDAYVGQSLDGKYRLDRLLGRGGMGAVYLARHLGTDRFVAVKVIRPQYTGNEEFIERFKREARAAGRLRHPNIVDVTDFGLARVGDENMAYLVMEYLDGCTLGDILSEENRLPLPWVVDILEQVCGAVHEAHKQGIVHRDLKPDNIWLEPNNLGSYRVKVLDFGIAKLAKTAAPPGREVFAASLDDTHAPARPPLPNPPGADVSTVVIKPSDVVPEILQAIAPGPARADAHMEYSTTLVITPDQFHATGPSSDPVMDSDLTRHGAIVGTPLFMSPEQCRGEALDARSDIYSLGVIAYQMLAGRLPFAGEATAVMRAHIASPPPPLREHARKTPKGVLRTITAALEKDPAARPQTALALAHALRANADDLGALYRQAFALYSQYFPKVFRLSFVAHVPVMAVICLAVGLRFAGPHLPKYGMVALELLLGAARIAASYVSASIISGVTAIFIAQLAVSPLRQFDVRGGFILLRRRWLPFLKTGMRATLRIMCGCVLLVIPGIILTMRYSLWAPVVLMEGLQGKAALARSRALASRSRGAVFIAMLFQFSLPVVVRRLIDAYFGADTTSVGAPEKQLWSQLVGLSSIFVLPLVSVVPALLYLKTRQLGGETLTDVMTQLEVEGARSQWQKRMRSRLSITPQRPS